MKNRLAADPEVLAALSGAERLAYLVGAQLNETTVGKALSMQWGHRVSHPVLAQTIRPRLHLEGAEHIPHRSHILAANHRTWFDLFAALIATWDHYAQVPFLYCPVRSAFYYERPLGVVLNLLVSGNCMYPPIFRDERGAVLNRAAVDACVRLLDWSPRALVAMHPEGTRNRDPDPYVFLPPKAGVGRIALRSRAPVVPVFVNGMAPSFGGLLKQRFTEGIEPVRVILGPAVALDDLYEGADDPAAHREAANRVMTAIAACGARDRAFMETWQAP